MNKAYSPDEGFLNHICTLQTANTDTAPGKTSMISAGTHRCRCKPASKCLQEQGIGRASSFGDVRDPLNKGLDQQVTGYHPSKAEGQNDALEALLQR